MRFEIVMGDITKTESDAIVNTAKSSLLSGSGVNGAIHKAAGPELLQECINLDGCEVGKAKVTRAFKLPAKYIFHTVGPKWGGGNQEEYLHLAECYINCCRLADSYACKRIIFPSISTGAHGYPLTEASKIAIDAILGHLDDPNNKIEQIKLVCIDQKTYDVYSNSYFNILIDRLIKYCTPKQDVDRNRPHYTDEYKYIKLVDAIAELSKERSGLGPYTDYIEMSERAIDRNADHVEKLDYNTTVATLICVHRELHWDNFSNAIGRRIPDGKLLRLATHLREAEKCKSNYVLDGIMGLVVADALGVPLEFQDRESLKKHPVHGMREYGTYNQAAGTWSDDSSMTLCTMDSLIHGLDYKNIMDNFSKWRNNAEYTPHDDVFDIGNATSKAISKYNQGMEPLLCGGTGEFDNGNGSLMRILPMALYQYAHFYHMQTCELQALIEPIHNVSRLTHSHKISLIACGLYSKIVGFILNYRNEKDLLYCIEAGLEDGFNYYSNNMKYEYKNVLSKYTRLRNLKTFQFLDESEIKSSGFVLDTLEAAIWCLLNSSSYKECVLKAVNLGDDTVTVAAVAGGLAGLYYGYNFIPDKWLSVIAKREWIKGLCSRFYQSLWGYELNER